MTFDESFIALRTLYGPKNLGISFLAHPLGNARFFVDKYTMLFSWHMTPGLRCLFECICAQQLPGTKL